jgi:HAD superfamily hydrolase (TIGR01509 family)
MSQVLLFDCDGVLADTEPHGHRVAFNRMWAEFGVPWEWSLEAYGRSLAVSGGKERLLRLFSDPDFLAVYTPPASAEARQELIAAWHKRKRALYRELIRAGEIPPRAGVKRLGEEALAAGWTLGVASTASADSVEAVLRHVVGEATAARFALVLAGDVVPAKKPAPDIYLLAAERLGVPPGDCVAIEDSRNGLLAAVDAGMRCVVTVSSYTRDEDFSEAALVLSSLGDPGGEVCEVLANRSAARPGKWFTVEDLEQVRAG